MAQAGPNPQTNLIFSIVAPVVALIVVAILYFTRPVPVAPPSPTPVNVSPAKLPDPGVVKANALPNAGTSASGGSGGGALGRPGGGGKAPGGFSMSGFSAGK